MGSITEISPAEAFELFEGGALLLDVRRKDEFDSGHLEGALNIPHDEVGLRLAELNGYRQKSIVVYCKSGGRSDFAARILRENGFAKTVNAGGYSDLSKTFSTQKDG